MSEFLLGERLSQEDTDKLANYLDIKNFRQNPAVNYQPLREAGLLIEGEEGFIRRGLEPSFNQDCAIIFIIIYFIWWLAQLSQENSAKISAGKFQH